LAGENSFFLLNADFAKTIPAVISSVHLASFVIRLPKYLKYFTFSSSFWSIIICTEDGFLAILNTLFYSAFIFTAKRLPVPIILLIMFCRTVSSLASITRSYFYFTVPITCTVWMSPNTSTASLVRYLLYNLKRNGHKQHPCLTLLPVFSLRISALFSRILKTLKQGVVNVLFYYCLVIIFCSELCWFF
jgi:hypothetical protein